VATLSLLLVGTGPTFAATQMADAPTTVSIAASLAAPSAPFVEGVGAQGLALRVAWTPAPESEQVTSYNVTATPMAGTATAACPTRTVTGISVSNSAAVVAPLCEGIAYTATVTALAGIAASAPSTFSNLVVPLAAQAPKTPLITDVTGRAGSLLVTWLAPNDNGGKAIGSYTLTATPPTGPAVISTPDGSAQSATISGLTNATTYTLSLTATSLAGTSEPASSSGTPQPAYVPGPPSGLTAAPGTSGDVLVSWQPPADDGGTPVTGYTVGYQQVTETGDTWALTPGSTRHVITVTGVATANATATDFEDAGAYYRFDIAATNSVGDSTQLVGQSPVSPTVEIADGVINMDATTTVALSAAGPTTLTWPARPAQFDTDPVFAGSVLICGPSGKLPQGTLRKVSAVTESAGSYQLTTTPGELTDVFTNMSMTAEVNPLADTHAAGVTQAGGATVRPLVAGVQAGAQAISGTTPAGFTIPLNFHTSEGKSSVDVTGSLTPTMTVAADVRWEGWHPALKSLYTRAVVKENVTETVSIEHEFEKPIANIRGATFSTAIGPVPIWITTNFPVYLSLSGKITVGVAYTADLGGDISWKSGRSPALKTNNLSTLPKPTTPGHFIDGVIANGHGEVAMWVIAQADIYDIGGPALKIKFSVTGDIDPNAVVGEAWLTLQPKITIELGGAIDIVGWAKKDQLGEVWSSEFDPWKFLVDGKAWYVISPPAPAVSPGGYLDLTAVRGDKTNVAGVAWTLDGELPGDTITSAGRLHVGANAGRHLVATITDNAGGIGSVTVTVGIPFDQAGSLTATQRSDVAHPTVDVTWSAPAANRTGDGALSAYYVTTWPDTGIHKVYAPTSALTLTGLSAGTLYVVRVFALNSLGQQSESASTDVQVVGPGTCTINWSGPDGGSWATAANWDKGRVPASGDWVCLGAGGAIIPTGTTTTIAGLSIGGEGPYVDDNFNGTLTVNGTLTAASYLSVDATIDGTGTLTVAPGATMDGTTNLFGARNIELNGSVRLVNKGTITGMTIGLNDASDDTAVLDNQGTLNLTVPDNVGIWGRNTDQGVTEVVNEAGATIYGTDMIDASLANSGILSVPAGGTLRLRASTLLGSGTLVGPGTFELDNGIAVLGSSPAFTKSPALVLSASVTIPGAVTLNGLSSLTISGDLHGPGTLTLPAGLHTSIGGATLFDGLRLVNRGALTIAPPPPANGGGIVVETGPGTTCDLPDVGPGTADGVFFDDAVLDNYGTIATIAGAGAYSMVVSTAALSDQIINEAGATITGPLSREHSPCDFGPLFTNYGTSDGGIYAEAVTLGSGASTRMTVSNPGTGAVVDALSPMGGPITVGGTLTVTPAPGYDPPTGTVVTAVIAPLRGGVTQLSGRFASVVTAGLTGRAWVASYGATAVTLTLTSTGVPGAPTATAATADNLGNVLVTWSPPVAVPGAPAITGYRVLASPGGAFTTTGATSATFSGLTRGTAYTFTVTARNAAGTGAASVASAPATPRTVPGGPSAVTAVTGSWSATVTWTAPGSNGGAAITGYTVTASPGGASAATTGATSGTVTGLTNGVAYTFTVTARNAAGTGAASVASAPVIPRTVPSAPSAVKVTGGNKVATVTWTAPVSNGGAAVTGYTVTANPSGRTATTTGAISAVVTGLANGTTYTFTVIARNVAGSSAASAPSAAVRLATTDFSGDGKADILTVHTNGYLYLYRGNGISGFAATTAVASGWGVFAKVLTPGDFTGDGKADIIAIKANGEVWLYRGNGAGGFTGAATRIGTGWNVYAKVFSGGDMTGDGKTDIVAISAAGAMYVYRGNGNGTIGTRTLAAGNWSSFVKVFSPGDFSGDGRADLVSVATNGYVYLYRGNGNGTFGGAVRIATGWNVFTKVFSPGDFSGDGRADLVGIKANGEVWLYRGTGTGTLGAGTRIATGWGVVTAAC